MKLLSRPAGLLYFTLMKLLSPEIFTACSIYWPRRTATKNHLPSIHWKQLGDIITHHITIHLRKACVDLGTSIAYLTHLLTARFVGFVYCEVFVVEILSKMSCLSDSVAGATELLAEFRVRYEPRRSLLLLGGFDCSPSHATNSTVEMSTK